MTYDFVLGNDTGTIGVFDDASIRELYDLDYHADHCLEYIDLRPGKYKVGLYVSDSYRGDIGTQVIVEVADGSRGLVVGDIGYAFNDNDWSDLCDATACLRQLELNDFFDIDDYYDITEEAIPIAVVSTGGDGVWDVTVVVRPYEEE